MTTTPREIEIEHNHPLVFHVLDRRGPKRRILLGSMIGGKPVVTRAGLDAGMTKAAIVDLCDPDSI